MNKEYSALVLMATYNGEKYIREQIESIEAQTFENWHLLIRDDGSTDGTLNIIKELQSKDNRIELVKNTTNKHGCDRNFFELIQIAKKREPYDFYFFSDQDDIFVKSKFADMINFAIISGENEKPLLVYSDLSFINESNDLTLNSLNKVDEVEMISPYNCFFREIVWGSASAINDKLLEIIQNPLTNSNIDIGWDGYIAKIAVGLGKAIYLDKPLVMHRIHRDNFSGNHKIRLSLLDYFGKLFNFKKRTRHLGWELSCSLVAIGQIGDHKKLSPQIALIKDIIKRGGYFGIKNMKRLGISSEQKIKSSKQKKRSIDLYTNIFLKGYKKYMF